MKNYLLAVMLFWGGIANAQDVVIFGEIHDNPTHHQVQADKVASLQPKAIVFEMITHDQVANITDEMRTSEEILGKALNWADSGWPDFTMYYPIFTASDAQIFGAAISRETAREVISEGMVKSFGAGTGLYGLENPLPDTEQSEREAYQAAVHCDALPKEMLPSMVDIQRFRDAVLARSVLQAMQETGGPVAVITGNGHARKDWGAPVILAKAEPELDVYVIGQSEDGAEPDGEFDIILDAPGVERPDPCLAFQ